MTKSTTPTTTTNYVWNESLIKKYDLSGPRYTSYPTAPQFSDLFKMSDWEQAVKRSKDSQRPLSLYFHLPFCDTVCYYCACNKIITANKKRAIPYLKNLQTEIEIQSAYVQQRPVQQLHWGGGTPTYLNDQQILELMNKIKSSFTLLENDEGEYSIEVHPSDISPERIQYLRTLGFNRLSMGVQDFNPEVQRAVNRFNSEEHVAKLIKASREYGFHSISIDLIYGLPLQTPQNFAQTLASIIRLQPDRISLFNYAHMPDIFKTQKQIDESQLPKPNEKLTILHNSIEHLTSAGYVYIGMDHFALPNDDLAIAQRTGKLHRNFQGYATHGNCDLFAFGVSAINSIDNTFSQNAKTIDEYNKTIESGQLPIVRGITLNSDDLLRREVIRQLICNFHLNIHSIEKLFNIVFQDYFKTELESLSPLAKDGLVTLSGTEIKVNPVGRLLIRSICLVFDRYFKKPVNKSPRFSKII